MSLFDGIESRFDLPLLLARLGLDEGNAVEVGVQDAIFARMMMGASNFTSYTLIDCWDLVEEDDHAQNDSAKTLEELAAMEQHVRELFEHCERVCIMEAFSKDALAPFPDEFLDFVYIDAAHDEAHVTEDLELWYPKVSPGGVIAGHDYLSNTPWAPTYVKFGVIEAVSKFRMKIPDHEFHITTEPVPSWVIVKPKEA